MPPVGGWIKYHVGNRFRESRPFRIDCFEYIILYILYTSMPPFVYNILIYQVIQGYLVTIVIYSELFDVSLQNHINKNIGYATLKQYSNL